MRWLLKALLVHWLLHLSGTVKICFTRPETTTPPTTTSATPTRPSSKPPTLTSDALVAGSGEQLPAVTLGLVMATAEAVDPGPATLNPRPLTVMSTNAPPPAPSPTQTAKTNRTKVRVRPKTSTTTTTVAPDVRVESEDVDSDDDNDSEEESRPGGEGRSSPGQRAGLGNFCSCNLLPLTCDINCCCDPDCAPRALQVFDCYAEPKHTELRTRLEDFQYQHGLPSCRINDGWLCVFRSNMDVGKGTRDRQLDFDTSGLHKWSSQMQEFAPPDPHRAEAGFYKFGQPLRVLNQETLELRNFELPFGFVEPHCRLQDPVRHLKPIRRQCLVNSLEGLQQHKHDLFELVAQHRLLRAPSQEFVELGRAGDNLLDLKLMSCHSGVGGECHETNSTDIDMENHYPGKIEILLRHNYTNLVDRSVVRMFETEIGAETWAGDAAKEEYWLTYEVRFEFYNGSSAAQVPKQVEPLAISGALGYLQGEPLIMAQMTQYNQSLELSADNALLDYFHPNATRFRMHHAIAVMSKRQELCFKDLTTKENLISYGINVLKQCKMRLDNTTDLSDNPGERNFTSVCVQLQELALNQLLPTNSYPEKMPHLWISQLGMPENNTETKWSKLELKNYEFAPIVGVFDAATRSFTCRNILLNVAYEFRVGRFPQQGVRHQNLVKHAALLFGPRHDLEFTLTEAIEMPLTMSVMFYDYMDAENQLTSGSNGKWHSISITIVAYLISKHFI